MAICCSHASIYVQHYANLILTCVFFITGFWLTFVSFLLLCFAGCTVCFGRRRDRLDGATTYSWRDRFRLGRKRY